MLAELESLLRDLEADTVDVDLLAAKVRRAQELVAACRARIEETRMEVERLLEPPPAS
jgi:exodeoxyribonuclease VII small subunit